MNSKSPTFCVLPWIHLEARTDGQVSPCCLSQQTITNNDGSKLYLFKDHIKEAFKSNWMETLRRQLNEGIQHPNCRVCWKDEGVGQDSRRKRENRRHEQIIKRNLATKEISEQPIFLDLKLGNLCNLKCRICGPYSSTKWTQESIDLFGEDSLPQNQSGVRLTNSADRKNVMNWYEVNPSFWNTIEEWLPKIEIFEIFGGEPFLITRHFELLKMSIEKGYSKNQSLHYNTNGTVFPEATIKEVFPEFKSVKAMFSLDGTGKQFEYQRFPAKWQTSFENLMKFKSLGVNVEICLTLSALNIYYLTDYLEFWSQWDVPIYLNVLDTPTQYNFQVFPQDVKQKILKKLSSARQDIFKKNILNSYQPVLDSLMDGDLSEHFPKFIKATKLHDNYRKQSYQDCFPEFYEIVKPYFETI